MIMRRRTMLENMLKIVPVLGCIEAEPGIG
jgi:hypothetical protein